MKKNGFSSFIESIFFEQFTGVRTIIQRAGAFIKYAHDVTLSNAIIASNKADATQASASATAVSQRATSASWNTTDTASTTIYNLIIQYNRIWLGAKTSDPSVDNNGDPVVVGASYFNTGENRIRVYRADGWHDYDEETQQLTNSANAAAQSATDSQNTAKNSALVAGAYASQAQNSASTATSAASNASQIESRAVQVYGGVSVSTPNSGLAGYFIRINSAGNAFEFRTPAQFIGDSDLITTGTTANDFLNRNGDTGSWLNMTGTMVAGVNRTMNGNTGTGGYCWSNGLYSYGWGEFSVGLQVTDIVNGSTYRNGAGIVVTNYQGSTYDFYFSSMDNSAYDGQGRRFLKRSDAPSYGSISNTHLGSGGMEGYGRFPNGTLIQWGYYPAAEADRIATTNNFPVEFPTAAVTMVSGNLDSQGSNDDTSYATILSNSQYYIACKGSTGINPTRYGVSWIAWGN